MPADPLPPGDSKCCSRCGETKPVSEFWPRADRPGLRSQCKACITTRHHERRGQGAIREDLFRAKVDTNGPVHPVLGTRCHPWKGRRSSHGYGLFTARGITTNASRVAWELKHGAIPPGMHVLHRCDNPPCCNADEHLFLGTPKDNSADMMAKGRHFLSPGKPRPLQKLTADDVRALRAEAAAGARPRELAAKYGIDESNARHIIARRAWRSVA